MDRVVGPQLARPVAPRGEDRDALLAPQAVEPPADPQPAERQVPDLVLGSGGRELREGQLCRPAPAVELGAGLDLPPVAAPPRDEPSCGLRGAGQPAGERKRRALDPRALELRVRGEFAAGHAASVAR